MNKRATAIARPKVYTSNEELVSALREAMFASGMTWKVLAKRTNVSQSTIAKLASGGTRWPRPTTLFPLISALGLGFRLEPLNQKGFTLINGGRSRG